MLFGKGEAMDKDNFTMLTDFYEITMANGFFNEGFKDRIVYFESLSPDSDLVQRAGPRLAEGTWLLAEKIYPELFS